jgi:hypothetical protein
MDFVLVQHLFGEGTQLERRNTHELERALPRHLLHSQIFERRILGILGLAECAESELMVEKIGIRCRNTFPCTSETRSMDSFPDWEWLLYRWVLHMGPTNSGKTYHALCKLVEAEVSFPSQELVCIVDMSMMCNVVCQVSFCTLFTDWLLLWASEASGLGGA